MIHRDIIKAFVREGLEHPLDLDWTLQGLGMLRTYLDDDRRFRLHVWDENYRVPNVTMLHTHPWDFDSYIVSGVVRQHRYVKIDDEVEIDYLGPNPNDMDGERWGPLFSDAEPWMEGMIICGAGGGECAPPVQVMLSRLPEEVYEAGATYCQTALEIHESRPDTGTVTIIDRSFHADTERAFVYYKKEVGWVSAEPRPALPEEIIDITLRALERF